MTYLGKCGGIDAVHRVVDRVPHGAEAGVAVAAHVDDIDARDSCAVDKDVVIGYGTALRVDEVAAGSSFPDQVNKSTGILH